MNDVPAVRIGNRSISRLILGGNMFSAISHLGPDRDREMRRYYTAARIHYKVLAGGRSDPAEAFAFVAKHLRPQDAVAVGVYTNGKPDLIEENIRLLRKFGAM
jgi:hypothetical protein